MPSKKTLEDFTKEGFLKRGSDPSFKVDRIPLGIPALDDFLGGGLPTGRCLEAYGPESTGKTLIAQFAVAAVQKTDKPIALFMDMERSFDKEWWEKSGVDCESLIVSTPATAEQAIDIMVAMAEGQDDLGIIVVDSIGAMVPQVVVEKQAEDTQQPGTQAKVITMMYHKLVSIIDRKRLVFYATNQMRETLGGYDEMAPLPGGRANRHYNHIILRTRREDWIKQGEERIGFYMEIVQRKNKTCSQPDGSSVTIPFLFRGEIDKVTATLDDAIKRKVVERKGAYYYFEGSNYLGMAAIREYLTSNEEALERLKNATEK